MSLIREVLEYLLAYALETWLPIVAAFLIALWLCGCAVSPPIKLDESKHYARNAEMEINGTKARATVVVARAPKYEIRIRSAGNMDFLLVNTCAREQIVERAGDDFRYTFEPNVIETSRACPIKFTGVEKGRNRRTVGWIDVEDPRHELGAELCCNGRCAKASGVSACESGAGLIQRITFQTPALSSTKSAENLDCKPLETKDGGLSFEFRQPRGECTHAFMELADPGRTHRLSTFGFDEQIPQKGR
jgi:hypothetical protein